MCNAMSPNFILKKYDTPTTPLLTFPTHILDAFQGRKHFSSNGTFLTLVLTCTMQPLLPLIFIPSTLILHANLPSTWMYPLTGVISLIPFRTAISFLTKRPHNFSNEPLQMGRNQTNGFHGSLTSFCARDKSLTSSPSSSPSSTASESKASDRSPPTWSSTLSWILCTTPCSPQIKLSISPLSMISSSGSISSTSRFPSYGSFTFLFDQNINLPYSEVWSSTLLIRREPPTSSTRRKNFDRRFGDKQSTIALSLKLQSLIHYLIQEFRSPFQISNSGLIHTPIIISKNVFIICLCLRTLSPISRDSLLNNFPLSPCLLPLFNIQTLFVMSSYQSFNCNLYLPSLCYPSKEALFFVYHIFFYTYPPLKGLLNFFLLYHNIYDFLNDSVISQHKDVCTIIFVPDNSADYFLVFDSLISHQMYTMALLHSCYEWQVLHDEEQLARISTISGRLDLLTTLNVSPGTVDTLTGPLSPPSRVYYGTSNFKLNQFPAEPWSINKPTEQHQLKQVVASSRTSARTSARTTERESLLIQDHFNCALLHLGDLIPNDICQTSTFRPFTARPREITSKLDFNLDFDLNPSTTLEEGDEIIFGVDPGMPLSQNSADIFTMYNQVDKKVKPVSASYPEDCYVQRCIPEDPLATLKPLTPHPPEFIPTKKISRERMKILNVNSKGFLSSEEEKLFQQIMVLNKEDIAFEDSERGTFKGSYFSPYIIPTVPHIPWEHANCPVPAGIRSKVMEVLRLKIEAGVYEQSSSSYRSRWFVVLKKNGKLRIVHDLQPLNGITICDAGMLPIVDDFVDSFAGRQCYTVLDLFWGFDARKIHTRSRGLTAFSTPIGLLQITSLPTGFTNSPAEFQKCMSIILQDEIPNTANTFIDDLPIKGPETQYLDQHGNPEVLAENHGIRRFIWEHAQDLH